jgi:hypothetical protein
MMPRGRAPEKNGVEIEESFEKVADGGTRGLRSDSPANETLARSVIGIRWIPENILHGLGMRASLVFQRDTMLRGVTASRA